MLSLLAFIICYNILSIGAANEELECPKISDGYYPDCRCKHGPAYDNKTNTCPNPECPVNESVGIYPNCVCQEKNFDYSATFNECFRVCPENSSGYWPKCICDYDGHTFSKELFKCIACPANSTGQYPDCNCEIDGAIFNSFGNVCKEPKPCPHNGEYPNCTCEGNAFYNDVTYKCQCPYGGIGIYPNCKCAEGSTYHEVSTSCKRCQLESVGVYPNCVCVSHNSTYVRDSNSCYTCPANSTGKYPNCDCEHPLQYVQEDNICAGCPEKSAEVYPRCKCDNGYFSKTLRKCIECPTDATGLYPACKCDDIHLLFSPFVNKCYRKCPDNSYGIRPQCTCDSGYYYDDSDFACKSVMGRICPFDSIGIGPDCLCVKKKHKFYSSYWFCLPEGAGFQLGPSNFCPRNNGRWPQCNALVDFKVLASSLG
ncbi:multiple epidermal growth factor-like domains protein 10 [Bradysia coprophila]|uniref:multiple epidermal growth factor-like domains protein 10 n=1 Tax=Bradysia coprophila TaxID=38358 RepID=UPI00187DB0EA|nr:multiple epidermal growth factor-like domains protein 10 [Bradysia coprophila]